MEGIIIIPVFIHKVKSPAPSNAILLEYSFILRRTIRSFPWLRFQIRKYRVFVIHDYLRPAGHIHDVEKGRVIHL